jgi:hypothetical protein
MFDLFVLRDTINRRVSGQLEARPAAPAAVRTAESTPRPVRRTAVRAALRLRAATLLRP